MAAKSNGSDWKLISLSPLSGGLDPRSRPADLPQGWFREKKNMSITPVGKLCRRAGFAKAFSQTPYTNQDLHHQNATREPITLLWEQTWGDATRELYAGTQGSLFVLDETTGDWTTIVSGKGASTSVWRAATLSDRLLFVNGVDDVQFWQKGGPLTNSCPELTALQVTAPRVIVEYNGFILLMNQVQSGVRQLSRVRWCDLNAPLTWQQPVNPNDPNTPANLSGYQDLDYGDEILAAMPLMGSLYIFTRRSIWRCNVAASANANQTFGFTRVYNEPKNQMGCLVFPYTLVSDGTDFWYMSRDSVYKWNPYMVAPDRKEADANDWIYRASGAIYTRADTQINSGLCNMPCADFLPTTRELWFSWPSGTNVTNNVTLVAQIDQRTADIVDHGFTAMANFREAPVSSALCNESQSFLAASGIDWAIKDLSAGVFYREMLSISGSLAEDVATPASYTTQGYYSELKGMVPLGYVDREKCVRTIIVDDDTTFEDVPCAIRMQVGTSYNLADPLDADDICAVAWYDLGTKPLRCADRANISVMKARNQRASDAIQYNFFYQAKFFYFWLRIENANGSAAIGGDTCLQRLDFDALAMPKP